MTPAPDLQPAHGYPPDRRPLGLLCTPPRPTEPDPNPRASEWRLGDGRPWRVVDARLHMAGIVGQRLVTATRLVKHLAPPLARNISLSRATHVPQVPR